MKKETNSKFRKFCTNTFVIVIVLAVLAGCGWASFWTAVDLVKPPTKAEKADVQAKIDKARLEELERIASNAQVGAGSAYIEIWCVSYQVKDTNGGYFYLGPGDIVTIKDIFCRQRNVHISDRDVSVELGNSQYQAFIIYFEPN